MTLQYRAGVDHQPIVDQLVALWDEAIPADVPLRIVGPGHFEVIWPGRRSGTPDRCGGIVPHTGGIPPE